MRKLYFAAASLLALAGCAVTPTDVTTAQTTQAKIASAVTGACADANAAAALAAPFAVVPQVAGVLTFITAGCAGAGAVAALTTKAVNDPSTIAWAEGLAGQVNGAVAAVKLSVGGAAAAVKL
jgi:hypothetical protein